MFNEAPAREASRKSFDHKSNQIKSIHPSRFYLCHPFRLQLKMHFRTLSAVNMLKIFDLEGPEAKGKLFSLPSVPVKLLFI